MTPGATIKKFVERSDPSTINRWKYDQTTAIAMTTVFPEPVAILNA